MHTHNIINTHWLAGPAAWLAVAGVLVFNMAIAQPAHAAETLSLADAVAITGVTAQDQIGSGFGAGDFNGDGYQDLAIGANSAFVDGVQTGAVYIIYGGPDMVADQTIEGDNVVVLAGEIENALGDFPEWAGFSVSSAGDMDADGYDDLVIGAPQNSDGGASAAGAIYIVYGSADQLTSGNLETIGVQLTGTQALEYLGYAVAGVGDVNTDGYADIVATAPLYNGFGSNDGRAFVVYGSEDRLTNDSIVDVGVVLSAENASDSLGGCVSTAGDLNGDGYDDFVIGAYGVSVGGADYIVYGDGTTLDATSVNAFVRLDSENANDGVGYACSTAGDLNADGYSDLVLGANLTDNNSLDSSGSAYIIYGSDAELTSQDLSFALRLDGAAAGENFAYHVGGADLNADGYSDLFFTAPYADVSAANSGSDYVVFGSSTEIVSGSITDAAGIIFNGVSEADILGSAIIALDMNGDGFNELVMSAVATNDGATDTGTVYIAYLSIDGDGDGTLGDNGLFDPGTDCNDADATVAADQTYYLDADADGLGLLTSTTAVCSSTPPEGYADNASDTDDTISNEGVEIGGDGIDNDNDGDIDEVNTVDGNGAHPEFGTVDPNDGTAVDVAVESVQATRTGKLRVKFSDNSVYQYTVFARTQTRAPRIINYPDTAYYVVMTASGRRLALVNVLDGTVADRLSLGRRVYAKHGLQFADLRSDDITEVVITSKKLARVRVAFAGVNVVSGQFAHPKRIVLSARRARPARTSIVGNTIDIRSLRLPLASIVVRAGYALRVAD